MHSLRRFVLNLYSKKSDSNQILENTAATSSWFYLTARYAGE